MLEIPFYSWIPGHVVVASAESIISCLNSRNCSAKSISLSELHHSLSELDVAKDVTIASFYSWV
ncbi:hypothetical protein T07_755 [Trichinella nelsoni]|uniref:Uncharacterized protein n=1 Tax=Trichinella nelsoni TaxID=6336 RepID=A0A0V0RPN3_9BILA|nr:hypothetical protein T07_755 [Trichinella nelsoni]